MPQRELRYTNPVFDRYFADPFVWHHDGEYFAVGTGAADSGGGRVFTGLHSQDLIHWRVHGEVLMRPESALGDTFWAHEVAYHAGTFFLYYSVGRADRGHQLRVATSPTPLGPYNDVGCRLGHEDCSFAIDPHPFRDDDGRWYLFHARDFLDGDARQRPGTALVVHRLLDMNRLGEGAVVLRARHDWQRFERDRALYGRTFDWHTLEGPTVCKRDGRYY